MQFFAPDLKTLRLWITEGRLHPDDQVSRTGKHWLRLGDMPEFSTAFAGFKGLPEVFSVSESPALDELGPPPSFAGSGSDGVPEFTSPPTPTGVIAIDPSKPAHGVNKSYVGKLPQPDPPPAPFDGSAGEVEIGGSMPDIPGAAYDGPEPGAPTPIELTPSGRPLSMLQAVTSHVQPITRATTDPATAASMSAAPAAAPTAAATPSASVSTRSDSPSSSALHKRSFSAEISRSSARMKRSRSSWPLIAALGGLTGVAVVFGIPSIRERVFGAAAGIVGGDEAEAADPQLEAARAALTTLDVAALAAADDALAQRGPDDAAAMALRAEIAATDVLTDAIAAIVRDEPVTPTAATDPFVKVSQPRAAALVALARGAAATTAGADEETALIAQAAGLWRRADAPVPAGVISGLESLPERSGLATLVLSLAYLRGGDRKRAAELAAGILEDAKGQPAALVLHAAATETGGGLDDVPLVADDDGGAAAEGTGAQASGGGTGGETADAPSTTGEEPGDETGAPAPASSGGGPGAGLSIDALIARGCDKVDGGDASGGVKMLEKAHDRRPNDVDVLSCLGTGYSKLGSYTTALKYYKLALDRSPRFTSALRGAGKAAAKLGRTGEAVAYYRRLLAVVPTDETAQDYVDAHGGSSGGGGADKGPDDGGGDSKGADEPPSSPPPPPPEP